MNSSNFTVLERLKMILQAVFSLKFWLGFAGVFSPATLPSGERFDLFSFSFRGVYDFVNVHSLRNLCWFLLGFIVVFYSAFSSAAWVATSGSYCYNVVDSHCPGLSGGSEWRSVFVSNNFCAPGGVVGPAKRCEKWNAAGTPCDSQPVNTEWDQDTQSCVEPIVCPDPGSPAGSLTTPDEQRGSVYCSGNCQIVASSGYRSGENFITFFEYTGAECIPGEGEGETPEAPTPDDPETVPEPGPSDSPDVDTDGDGTPDGSDGDIDGDGTPNGTDTDSDGDGVPNVDDKTPLGGNEEKEPSSASTSDDCFYVPSCSGDAIQCAQLMEIWRLRCMQDESEEESTVSGHLDCGSFSCEGDVIQCAVLELQHNRACALAVDTVVADMETRFTADGLTAVDDSVDIETDFNLSTEVGDFLAPDAIGGACISAPSFAFLGSTIEIPVDMFCDVALMIRPFLLLSATIFGALMFFNTLRDL